jgi:hypothetical protein
LGLECWCGAPTDYQIDNLIDLIISALTLTKIAIHRWANAEEWMARGNGYVGKVFVQSDDQLTECSVSKTGTGSEDQKRK